MLIRARLRPVVILLVAALTVAACSGGDDSSTSDTKETKEKATTTTKPAQADEVTARLAAGLVFSADDFPDGWTVAAEPVAYATEGVAPDDCFNPADGELATLARGATVGGPTMRSPDAPFFITTWSATFPDEAAAIAWSEYLASAEKAECERALRQEAADDGVEVRTDTSPERTATIGEDYRVAATDYAFEKDGTLVSRMYTSAYRIGRTVVTVRTEVGPMEEAQQTAGLEVEAQLRGDVFDRAAQIEPSGG